MRPSLEGLPTKAKEGPPLHEMRLSPLDINPVFPGLREIIILINVIITFIIIITIIIIIIIVITIIIIIIIIIIITIFTLITITVTVILGKIKWARLPSKEFKWHDLTLLSR